MCRLYQLNVKKCRRTKTRLDLDQFWSGSQSTTSVTGYSSALDELWPTTNDLPSPRRDHVRLDSMRNIFSGRPTSNPSAASIDTRTTS